MSRQATQTAGQNANIGQQNSGAFMGTNKQVLGTVVPDLTAQAQNGIDPATLAAMNTASEQSLGGANASAAGQGALMEARTRNAGAANPAIEESARDAMRQRSQNAVGIQSQNYDAKQAALRALQGLYGTSGGLANQALGLSNQATGIEQQAPGWLQNTLGIISALKPGGNAGGFSFGGSGG